MIEPQIRIPPMVGVPARERISSFRSVLLNSGSSPTFCRTSQRIVFGPKARTSPKDTSTARNARNSNSKKTCRIRMRPVLSSGVWK